MALAALLDKSTMVSDLLQYLNSRYPSADSINGTVLRDILIEAPTTFFYETELVVDFLSNLINFDSLQQVMTDDTYRANVATLLNQPQSIIDQMVSDVVSAYATNYGFTRKPAQTATGNVTFYITVPSTLDINIPTGSVVTTGGTTALQYTTTGDVTIFAGNLQVITSITASSPGSVYNVAANTILNTTAANVSAVNSSNVSGGYDQESDIALLSRISNGLKGNFQGTASSIVRQALASSSVQDARLVYLADDPLRQRTAFYQVDLWVLCPSSAQYVQLNAPPTYDGSTSSIKLINMPVDSIVSVVDQTIGYTFPSLTYNITYQGILEHSIQENSSVTFTTITSSNIISTTVASDIGYQIIGPDGVTPIQLPGTGTPGAGSPIDPHMKIYNSSNSDITNAYGLYNNTTFYYKGGSTDPNVGNLSVYIGPIANETVVVTYNYNQAVASLQNSIASPATQFIGQDILVREAQAATVNISVTVLSDGTVDQATLIVDVQTAITAITTVYQLGYLIQMVDVETAVRGVQGVADVRTPLNYFKTDSATATYTTFGDLQFSNIEYPVAATPIVTVLTNRVVSK
jgi:hypothetical protein